MSFDLYQENILEHFQAPHNKGRMEHPSIHYRDLNPLCGDEIEFFLKLDGNLISEVGFLGDGCAISQASASMLTDELKGKQVDFLKGMDKDTVLGLLGIELSPVRMKCALLSVRVLKMAYYRHLGQKEQEIKEKLDDAGLGY